MLEEAKRRKLLPLQEIFTLFDELRRKTHPTDFELEQIVNDFYEDGLKEDEAVRRSNHGIAVVKQNEIFRPAFEAELRRHLSTGETSLVSTVATDLLIQLGYQPDEESDPFKRLCQMLLRAQIEICARIRERDAGDFTGTPRDALLARRRLSESGDDNSSQSEGTDSRKPLSALLEKMHREKSTLALATKEEQVMVVETFEDYLGYPKAIRSITKADLIGFKDQLLKTPKNRSQVFPGRSLAESIRLNESRENPAATLSAKTINGKYLAHLKVIFNWAIGNNLATINVADKVSVATTRRKQKNRFPFQSQDFKKIFSAREFAANAERNAKFWAILIAAYSGLRAGEIGQLEVQDITELYGVWCFKITEWSDREDGRRKSLKTGEQGIRCIPIHPELVKIGIIDLAEFSRRQGHQRLLPDWKPNARGDYSQGVPRWFNRTFLPRVGLERKELVFHSFRHSFKDLCRDAGIGQEIHDFLTGHAAGGVSGGYGMGAGVKTLFEAIAKVTIAEVDLSHLYVGRQADTGTART
jgi:integrase